MAEPTVVLPISTCFDLVTPFTFSLNPWEVIALYGLGENTAQSNNRRYSQKQQPYVLLSLLLLRCDLRAKG